MGKVVNSVETPDRNSKQKQTARVARDSDSSFQRRKFPTIAECTGSAYESIAADLDGTLLLSSSSFPYFMLVAIEAGSLLRGLILLLSVPIIIVSYFFISESFGIQILIFISFAGLKVRDIELASRAVLP
ncbi:hypothetical protein CRG98_047031, partial [Punica granatum]